MAITIFGIHPVLEAIKKRPQSIHRILLAKEPLKKNLQMVLSLSRKHGIHVHYDTQKNIARLAGSSQHQGIVAETDPFPLVGLDDLISIYTGKKTPVFFLILDCLQDPHNFGSLIRSGLCSGAQAVIFPKDRAAPLTATVAKASAGAVEHVSLCRVVNIASAMDVLKKHGIWVIGTTPSAGKNIYEFDFSTDTAVVIGSEEKGMRPLTHKKCDNLISIPILPPLDSLNASVAGAVVMFEVMRQRLCKG